MHATLKHFPGHGADIGDSHISMPIDHRSFEEIYAQDLIPFKNLIETDPHLAIMPAHVIYSDIDPLNTAGTSEIWLKDILREQLHFEGVIISDCLSMVGAGIDNHADKILKALEYGDLALLSHQTPEQYLNLLDMLDQQQFEWSELSQARVQQWLLPNSPVITETQAQISVYAPVMPEQQIEPIVL